MENHVQHPRSRILQLCTHMIDVDAWQLLEQQRPRNSGSHRRGVTSDLREAAARCDPHHGQEPRLGIATWSTTNNARPADTRTGSIVNHFGRRLHRSSKLLLITILHMNHAAVWFCISNIDIGARMFVLHSTHSLAWIHVFEPAGTLLIHAIMHAPERATTMPLPLPLPLPPLF